MSKTRIIDFLRSIKNPEQQKYLQDNIDWLDYSEPDIFKKYKSDISVYHSQDFAVLQYRLFKEALRSNPNILSKDNQKLFIRKITTYAVMQEMSFEEKQEYMRDHINNVKSDYSRRALSETLLYYDYIEDIKWKKCNVFIDALFYDIFGKDVVFQIIAEDNTNIHQLDGNFFTFPYSKSPRAKEIIEIIKEAYKQWDNTQKETFMLSFFSSNTAECIMDNLVVDHPELLKFITLNIKYKNGLADTIFNMKDAYNNPKYSDKIRKFILASKAVVNKKFLKIHPDLTKDIYGLLRMYDNDLQIVFNSLFPKVEDKNCLKGYY